MRLLSSGYDVEQLERIDRSGGVRVLGFPDAGAVDPQQEMADGPIIRVHPSVGQPITSVLAAADHEVVVFSDFTSFTAYDRGGLRWRKEVASDDATLVSVEGDEIVGTGSLNGVNDRSIWGQARGRVTALADPPARGTFPNTDAGER